MRLLTIVPIFLFFQLGNFGRMQCDVWDPDRTRLNYSSESQSCVTGGVAENLIPCCQVGGQGLGDHCATAAPCRITCTWTALTPVLPPCDVSSNASELSPT